MSRVNVTKVGEANSTLAELFTATNMNKYEFSGPIEGMIRKGLAKKTRGLFDGIMDVIDNALKDLERMQGEKGSGAYEEKYYHAMLLINLAVQYVNRCKEKNKVTRTNGLLERVNRWEPMRPTMTDEAAHTFEEVEHAFEEAVTGCCAGLFGGSKKTGENERLLRPDAQSMADKYGFSVNRRGGGK
jgi:hypothetical protein